MSLIDERVLLKYLKCMVEILITIMISYTYFVVLVPHMNPGANGSSSLCVFLPIYRTSLPNNFIQVPLVARRSLSGRWLVRKSNGTSIRH